MPNFFIDELMPTLGDTQWRLLCVIVRQTLGWQEDRGTQSKGLKGRKERDWLSHAQLKARTGRQSAALCQAIEELVMRQLIEVQDEQGRPLSTAQERRRVRSRLYYRLHPDCLISHRMVSTNEKNEEEQDFSQQALADGLNNRTQEDGVLQNEAIISQSEFHKAKTTKENQTKAFLKNNLLLSSQSEKSLLVSSQNGEKSDDAGNLSSNQNGEQDRERAIDSFIERYQSLYQHYRPGQSVPPISATDRELLKRRLQQHSSEVLEKWLPLFFASTFGYVRRRNYSLESFLNSWHVIQAARRNR